MKNKMTPEDNTLDKQIGPYTQVAHLTPKKRGEPPINYCVEVAFYSTKGSPLNPETLEKKLKVLRDFGTNLDGTLWRSRLEDLQRGLSNGGYGSKNCFTVLYGGHDNSYAVVAPNKILIGKNGALKETLKEIVNSYIKGVIDK